MTSRRPYATTYKWNMAGTATEDRKSVCVILSRQDQAALRAEALRRLETGEAVRIDVSAIVRELVRGWREGRAVQ